MLSIYFRYFEIISFWTGRGPSFEQTWIPLPKEALRQIDPAVLEKKMKCEKIYIQTDGRRTTGDQKSLLDLSAQVSE